MDGVGFLLMLDGGTGELRRIRLADGTTEKVAGGLSGCAGLAWDPFGRLFIGDQQNNRILVIARPEGADRHALQARRRRFLSTPTGTQLLIPDAKAGTLAAVPIVIPGREVDMRPLPSRPNSPFPNCNGPAGRERPTTAGSIRYGRFC